MTRARQIRVGVLGAGSVVRSLHLPVLQALPNVDVPWICDDDLDLARNAAKVGGIRTACSSLEQCSSDVDVVLVAIPVGSRRSALEMIIRRGQHAFCEKPFAPSLADHRSLISHAREAGVFLGSALVRRVFGSTVLARQLVSSGVLGAVKSVYGGEGSRIQRTGREPDWYQASPTASGGGVLIEAGTHLVDQVMTICQVRTFSIDACVQRAWEGLEFDTTARGALELASGDSVRFRLDVSRLRDVYNGIVIRFEHGEVRLGLGVDSTVELTRGADDPVRLATSGPRDAISAFAEEWVRFLARPWSGVDMTDEDTGLLTTALIDACYTVGRGREDLVTAT